MRAQHDARVLLRDQRRRALVKGGVSFVAQPPMSLAAATQLVSKRADLGKNPSKARGVGQNTLMDTWAASGGALGSFMTAVNASMAGHGAVVNKFMGLNNGELPQSSWHTDLTLGWGANEPTHRLVANYNDGEGGIGIAFRWKAAPTVVVVVRTPPGCAPALLRSLMTNPEVEHAHFGSGRINVSFIYDVRVRDGGSIVGLTAPQIAAAAVTHVPLNFGALFVFDYDDFKGAWRKGGIGGGSVRRLAVAAIAGPKQGGRGSRRKVPLKVARERAAAMTDKEQRAMALPGQQVHIQRLLWDVEENRLCTAAHMRECQDDKDDEGEFLVIEGGGAAAKGASPAPARPNSAPTRPHSPTANADAPMQRGAEARPRAASHILGRPGPGEPSGFPVVPGRAEGVARRPALPLRAGAHRCVVPYPPLPLLSIFAAATVYVDERTRVLCRATDPGAVLATAGAEAATAQSKSQAKKGTYFGTAATTRGTASRILGRPGPGEPSGFLVVPGRAEGVACGAAHALRASTSAPLLAPPHPRSPTPPARSPPFASRATPLRPSLSLSSLPPRSQQVHAPRLRLHGRGARLLHPGVPRARRRPPEGRGRRR